MAFKSSRGRDLGKELVIYMSSKIGQGIGGAAAAGPGIVATGGVLTVTDTHYIHIFNSTAVFAPLPGFSQASVEAVVVAGGGGGGCGGSQEGSGGGGAGGYRTLSVPVCIA